MNLFLDLCCFGRLFDEQKQPRICLESEAVVLLLQAVRERRHKLITSDVLELENAKNPDVDQCEEVANLLKLSSCRVVVCDREIRRTEELIGMGFRTYDAFHIACAESGGADYLLSTDDDVVSLGQKLGTKLAVTVANPLKWLEAGAK